MAVVGGNTDWVVRRRWADPARDGIRDRFRTRFGHARNPLRGFTRARREKAGTAADVADGCLPDEILLITLAVFVAVIVFIFLWELFLFAVVAAIGEFLWLALIVGAGFVARSALRHPWTIQATHSDGRVVEWQVRGLRRSKQFVTSAQRLLDGGREPDEIRAPVFR